MHRARRLLQPSSRNNLVKNIYKHKYNTYLQTQIHKYLQTQIYKHLQNKYKYINICKHKYKYTNIYKINASSQTFVAAVLPLQLFFFSIKSKKSTQIFTNTNIQKQKYLQIQIFTKTNIQKHKHKLK